MISYGGQGATVLYVFLSSLQWYKRNYDARVWPVNKDFQAGDWVFVDGHARTKNKLATCGARPYKVFSAEKARSR